jgi:predicted DNA-binding transcriptional regulator AlpA
MGKARGERLALLPAVLNPEQRLTADQAMALAGQGRTQFYGNIKVGKLPQPERDGPRFVRWRAGSLIDALNKGQA